MSIMDKLKDPELLAALGVGDKLLGSLIVMVLGLACCILVLLLIMIVVNLLKIASTAGRTPVKVEPADAPDISRPEADEAELVAAITAAIAEMEGNGQFYIRNIIAVSERESWSKAGLEEAVGRQHVAR